MAGLCLVIVIGGVIPVIGAGTSQPSAADPNSNAAPTPSDTQATPIVAEKPPWHDDTGARPQQDPKALDILKAGLKAMGGEEVILGRKTIYLKRKVTNYDYPEPREGTLTLWYKRPNKIRKEISYPPDATRHAVVELKPMADKPRPMTDADLEWLKKRRVKRKNSHIDAGALVSRMRDEEWK